MKKDREISKPKQRWSADWPAPVGGTFADHYRLEALLGEGGMGVVYLARHITRGHCCAIKLIRRGLLSDPKVVRRFEREARTMRSVQHPNVARVLDFGSSADGVPYIAMEYVQGIPLKRLIHGQALRPTARALGVLLQIIAAVGAAHEVGVVHRDLKPGNVMLASGGPEPDWVKVLDFGLAKSIRSGSSAGLSTEGTFGTPQYLSPEEIRGEKVDFRADLYSFGVLAFEVLTGRLPFSGSVASVIESHINTPPPRPSSVSGKIAVDAATDSLVLRCLAKRPEFRFESAAEIVAAIRAIQATV